MVALEAHVQLPQCNTRDGQFCIEGHGWLPSRLLYRNCKSVCVMVRETRQHLFLLYGHSSHSGLHWYRTISAPLSAREHRHVCSIFLHYLFAYNQSDRYVLHCICIIYSSKWQLNISIVFNRAMYTCISNCWPLYWEIDHHAISLYHTIWRIILAMAPDILKNNN